MRHTFQLLDTLSLRGCAHPQTVLAVTNQAFEQICVFFRWMTSQRNKDAITESSVFDNGFIVCGVHDWAAASLWFALQWTDKTNIQSCAWASAHQIPLCVPECSLWRFIHAIMVSQASGCDLDATRRTFRWSSFSLHLRNVSFCHELIKNFHWSVNLPPLHISLGKDPLLGCFYGNSKV